MRYPMRQNIVYFYIYVSDIKLHFLMLKKVKAMLVLLHVDTFMI